MYFVESFILGVRVLILVASLFNKVRVRVSVTCDIVAAFLPSFRPLTSPYLPPSRG